MRNRLVCAALLLCTACIKRIAPSPGETRSAPSGTEVAFGAAQELPGVTIIHWQFGDGTPEQTGAQVVHVFPRAGNFKVVETVVDRDGETRAAEVVAQITRRSVASAVPADARSALILERPWSHVDVQRRAAERVGLGELFHENDREFSELFGFTASDPKAAEQNGVDTDEGLALYTVPQDREALVACAGISDPQLATASLQHLLAHDSGGPFLLRQAKLADGTAVTVGERNNGAEKIGYLEHLGYLYLRAPGASDPLLALSSAAALGPEQGLEKDKGFNAALARVGPGDALFYWAGNESDALSSRFGNQLDALSFSITTSKDEVRVQAFGKPRNLAGKELVDALSSANAPPDFAGQLPVGAALYAKLAGQPPRDWAALQKAMGPDGQVLRDRLHDLFGGDVDALLPAFTGNGAVALYLDAQAFIEAMLGEQVGALDRSTFITISELRAAEEAHLRAALDHASLQSSEHVAGREVRGATFWKLFDSIQVAIRGKFMFAAIGGAPEVDGSGAPENGKGGDKAQLAQPALRKRGKTPAPPPELTPAEVGPLAAILFAPANAPALALQLSDTQLPFDSPTSQLLWADIRGTLSRLEAAADAQGGMVGIGVSRLTDRVRGLRDALVSAHAEPDGISATITLRFMPEGVR